MNLLGAGKDIIERLTLNRQNDVRSVLSSFVGTILNSAGRNDLLSRLKSRRLAVIAISGVVTELLGVGFDCNQDSSKSRLHGFGLWVVGPIGVVPLGVLVADDSIERVRPGHEQFGTCGRTSILHNAQLYQCRPEHSKIEAYLRRFQHRPYRQW